MHARAAAAGGLVIAAVVAVVAYRAAHTWRPEIPRVWDEAALAGWATPLAGLGAAPTHMSAADYYAIPEENLRSYPLYMPDREPPGYFERLQSSGPQPLIEPGKLLTQADWVAAGERVFLDSVVLKTFDPNVIALARSQEAMRSRGTGPLPDGTINGLRWLPTKDGLAVGLTNCSACHLLYLPDNTPVPGASSFAMPNNFRNGIGGAIRDAAHTLPGEPPFALTGPIGEQAYQAYGAPWANDPAGERLREITTAEFNAYVGAAIRGGGVARWNGSLLYPTKIPDLIGIKDRKYIDHTGTHAHRNIGDLMRYAALVSFADDVDFAGHHVIGPGTERFRTRLPDAALYALALYVYSLEPPPNPESVRHAGRGGPEDLRARALRALPHAAALHEQQAHAGRGLHAARRLAARHRAHVGAHGPRSRAAHAQGHGLLQGAVVEGRVVPRALPARRLGREPRGDVRPRPAARHARAERLHVSRHATARDPRPRVRTEARSPTSASSSSRSCARSDGARRRVDQARHSAGMRSGASAPVITATVSLMLIFFGFSTAARLPRRATWMRSATSNTCGMLCVISTTGRPAVAHAPDQLEHHVAFLHAERGGRLVHDHDVLRERRARATATHWRWPPDSVSTACVIERMPTFSSFMRAMLSSQHLLLVEHAQHVAEEAGPAQLAAEEQVLGDGHRRRDGQVLVDRLDAGAARVDRAPEVDRLAVEQDLALVGDGARPTAP